MNRQDPKARAAQQQAAQLGKGQMGKTGGMFGQPSLSEVSQNVTSQPIKPVQPVQAVKPVAGVKPVSGVKPVPKIKPPSLF